jgi:hypothetical protein
MSEPMSGVSDPEAPTADAFEQSLPVSEAVGDQPPIEAVLSTDLEAPEPDVIEQHQPAPPYEEDDWR